MREFARRNAGITAAAGAYAVLAVGGVLAIQQLSTAVPTPGVPPGAMPSSPASPSTPPAGGSSSPSTRPTSPAAPTPNPSLLLAERRASTGRDSNSASDRSTAGAGAHPTPTPSGQSSASTAQSSGCGDSAIAVRLPGDAPCDTVRVGHALTVGGDR